MSFYSWLQNIRSALAPSRGRRNHGRRGSLRATTHRPNLEALEDRCLPSFSPVTSFPVGLYPFHVATGDFNNDSRLDLATANVGDSTVSVLLENADTTFQPAQTAATGSYPKSVAVGDFDTDGNLDLATAHYDDGTHDNDISILLGNGDGTFVPAVRQSIDSNLESCSVATGDLNADGKVDLVVTSVDPGGLVWEEYASVRVLLGLGDGNFAPVATVSFRYNGWVEFSPPVLADFDRDGNADVAVAVHDEQTDSIRVLLGYGDGTLRAPRDLATDSGANSVAVGDFNADNKLDLAAGTSNGVNVLLGNGDGTFQTKQSFAMGNCYSSAAVGDLNGDGMLDLVVTGAEGVSVLLGNGDGSFALPITTAIGGSSLVVADFNADGRPDAASADLDSNTVSVLLNDGNWPPLPPTPPAVSIRDVTVTEGNTGTAIVVFTVTLSAAYGQPVTVAYTTASGTATAGSDYQSASGTLTIPAGQTTGMITVLVNGDRLGEPNETFFANLSSPTNATITDTQAVGTIVDDEPHIGISDVTKAEGKNRTTTLFTFTVTLSAAYDQAVAMSYRTVDGTAKTGDQAYIAKTGTLTFTPGETTKMITIEVKGDNQKEANETFYLDLFGLSSNGLFTKNRGIGTILNDD